MGRILENWRIALSALFAGVVIVGSFMLARGIESPRAVQASAESALLQAIATKDSDGDGLTDWEEALYGTDSQVSDTFHLGMTDGEAVARGLIVPKAIADIKTATSSLATMPTDGSLPPPAAEGTLTAAFAQNFFTLYLAAKQAKGGADLSESDMSDISNQALSSLSSAIASAPNFKSAADIKVSENSADAMKEFAAQAEAVLHKNTSSAKKNELLYLQDAVQKNDASALPHIAEIAKGYRESAVGLAALAVPAELVIDHLLLVNSMMRISEIANDFTRVNTDPLAAILALQQYPQAVQLLGTAFLHIGQIYTTAGVSLPAGVPGARFVNLVEDMTKEQASAKKI